MNVIIAYLETMFSAYPQTPRLLEAKAELRGMMEDAYTALIAEGRTENEAVGQVIRDFGNLEEVAPVLGITADITPAASGSTDATETAAERHPVVTLDEAQGYADAKQRTRYRLSTAVMFFVLSPSLLLLLSVAGETGILPLGENAGTFIGLFALLVMIAVGVLLIFSISRETAPYKRISEGRFSTNPTVTQWAEALSAKHEPARIRSLQIAVTLWILSAAPLLAFALLVNEPPYDRFLSVLGVVLVLVMVASGLGVLLPRTWAHSVAEELTRSRRTWEAGDDEHSIVGIIAAFYWPLLVAIFLAWSFIGNAWGVSWMVWPIGAVLFGAIAGGVGALEAYRRARR